MILTLVTVLFLAVAESATVYSCPNGWTQFDGHCFFLNSTSVTFPEAAEYCQSLGGYLIEVQTAKKNSFMKSFMNDIKVEHGIWLGANDLMFEGSFVWDKSEAPLTFKDWYPGEPNQKTTQEDCMSSWAMEGYQWADHYCDHADLAAMCERPATKCA